MMSSGYGWRQPQDKTAWKNPIRIDQAPIGAACEKVTPNGAFIPTDNDFFKRATPTAFKDYGNLKYTVRLEAHR